MSAESRIPRWQILAILALAAALRLYDLNLRPAHFDEGVNGWFADQMTRTGYFRYDPTNYHGPLHFYAVFVSQTLLGRAAWVLRLPAVLASVLAVWATLKLARFLGPHVRLAAVAMAVSPGFVFFGRYSIHESWLALFILLTLYGVLGLWERGTREYLWWVAAGLTGMVLTKETYIIHVVALAAAWPCLLLWQRVSPSKPALDWSARGWTWGDLGKAVAVSALVLVAFYSGMFLDFGALRGIYETFAAWFQTGVEAAGHEKPAYQFGPLNFYWLALMARYEPAALAGFACCFVTLWRCDARVRYVAIYGAGVLLAYSIIPYKTPWCVIAILPPFLLVASSVISRLPRMAEAIVWAPLIAASAFLALRLNFVNFAADNEPYVYVQTYPEIADALDPLLDKAREDPLFFGAEGKIILESYYPLPWLLGDFTAVGYFGEDDVPARMRPVFVLTSAAAADRVQAALEGAYYRRPFRLRSGVGDCVAFFRFPDFQERFGGHPDVVGQAPEISPP